MSIDLKLKSDMRNTDDTDRNDDDYLDDSPTSQLHMSDKKTNHKPSHIHDNELSRKLTYVSIRSYPMISIMIGGKERVCLAQISNTLLKKFSYNEIHNRRVALGINCIQCTPAQLELLRSAGAMPISSRRCGMITKREAERLVKSFLDENKPPCLPENFAFEVYHKCGFGCRGTFYPSRYNSSRAKCIKCKFCNLYFSPNKFIFHYHETPNAIFIQSNTINFNSWRRHIQLVDSSDEHLSSAWEDVKSIFNSGKRKRSQSSPLNASRAADDDDDFLYSGESENESNNNSNVISNHNSDEDSANELKLKNISPKSSKNIVTNNNSTNNNNSNQLLISPTSTIMQQSNLTIPNIFDFLNPLQTAAAVTVASQSSFNPNNQLNPNGNFINLFSGLANKNHTITNFPFLNPSIPQLFPQFGKNTPSPAIEQQNSLSSMSLYIKAQQELFKRELTSKLIASNNVFNFTNDYKLNGDLFTNNDRDRNKNDLIRYNHSQLPSFSSKKSTNEQKDDQAKKSTSKKNTDKKKNFISIAEHFE
jgi:hypothetical protein